MTDATAEAHTTFLRPAEAAERLRISERTVYRLVENGELRPTYVGRNRSLRIRLSDLAAYVGNVKS